MKNLIEIPEKNIIMRFAIDEKEYVVFYESEDLQEGEPIYFAKIDRLETGIDILRNIEDDEEYNLVVKRYDEIIDEIGDEDEF